jgi:tetratricopeptide (TPR) repeat protein
MRAQLKGLFGKRLIACGIAGGVLSIAAVSAAPDSSWNQLYADGQNALNDQKLDKAEDDFRAALKKVPASDAGSEKCMLRLADTLTLRNKTLEAQSLYQKLLGILTKRYGASSAQIAPILLDLGSIQEAAGDHSTAIVYYQRALQINEKNYGAYSPAVATSLQSLGRANAKAGNRDVAAKHYKQSFAILNLDPSLNASTQLESLHKEYGDLMKGDDSSNRDLINDFQADILKNGGTKNPGDQPELRQKITPPSNSSQTQGTTGGGSAWQQQSRIQFNEVRSSQANEDPKVILRGIEQPASDKALRPAYNVINDSIFNQDHFEKGEEYYQRTIASDIDSLGPSHPSVANDLSGLGRLYLWQQRYADAQPVLSRALSIYEKVYGSNNLLTINARVALASAEFHLGHNDRAAELYRNALSNGQAALGPNSLETARILNELAYLYYHQGKLQEARTFYEWAVASTEGAVGQQNPLLAACLKDYAQVLRSLGQTDQASAAESRADKILASSH